MNNRSRNFSGVFYPESCPPNFLEVIENFKVKCALSPLHTPDDECKKPHYHIVFAFSGNKSIEQVREMMYKLGSSMVQIVSDVQSVVRYLIHKDNPEKEQLDKKDIKVYNWDIEKYFKCTKEENLNNMRTLIKIANENKCRNYKELFKLCLDDNDLLSLLLKYSYAINLYLRSL